MIASIDDVDDSDDLGGVAPLASGDPVPSSGGGVPLARGVLSLAPCGVLPLACGEPSGIRIPYAVRACSLRASAGGGRFRVIQPARSSPSRYRWIVRLWRPVSLARSVRLGWYACRMVFVSASTLTHSTWTR